MSKTRRTIRPKFQRAGLSDTTGSMASQIGRLLRKSREIVAASHDVLPGLEWGWVAQGDLCDFEDPYVVSTCPLTPDLESVVDWLRRLKFTYGGDHAEAYGLGLKAVADMVWDASANKAFIYNADAIPHDPSYYSYDHLRREFGISRAQAEALGIPPKGIDWRKEARRIRDQDIVSYVVQWMNWGRDEDDFHEELAEILGAQHFRMSQISYVGDLVLGFTHHQAGPEAFEQFEVKLREKRGTIPFELEVVFSTLAGRSAPKRGERSDRIRSRSLTPVDPSRFQRFVNDDDEAISIKDWAIREGIPHMIQDNGKLKTGLVFNLVDEALYPKTEVRPRHNIVIHDTRSDEWFTGDEVRDMLGCPPKGQEGIVKLRPWPLGPNVEVYKQSTSPNRKFEPGTVIMVDYKPELGWD